MRSIINFLLLKLYKYITHVFTDITSSSLLDPSSPSELSSLGSIKSIAELMLLAETSSTLVEEALSTFALLDELLAPTPKWDNKLVWFDSWSTPYLQEVGQR